MELKEILTLCGLSINAIGLIVALVKFSQEQAKNYALKQQEVAAQQETLAARQKELAAHQKAEQRTEYKLRLYQSLIQQQLTFEEIVTCFREQTPISIIDEVELRKCVYEMLVEGTLRAYEDKTYTANTEDDYIDNDDDDDDLNGAADTPAARAGRVPNTMPAQ